MQYQDTQLTLTQEIYEAHLATINTVRLSKREIDIIACVLNGRSAKGIGHFLSLSPRTVEAHIYNAMRKLGCSSRENLITLLENTKQFLTLKSYYLNLLTDNTFQICLKNIVKERVASALQVNCLIIYWEESNSTFFNNLQNHLILAGIPTSLEMRKQNQTFSQLLKEIHGETYTIYALPDSSQTNLMLHEDYSEKALQSSFQSPLFNKSLFLIPATSKLGSMPFSYVNFADLKNYYLLVFAILTHILPSLDLTKIVADFEGKHGMLNNSSGSVSEQGNLEKNEPTKIDKSESFQETGIWLTKKLFTLSFLLIFLLLIVLGLFSYYKYFDVKGLITKVSHALYGFQDQENLTGQAIRSDLVIPATPFLLNRVEIVRQIEGFYRKHPRDIETIALIGIGGAGKTTLARQYARQQKSSIIWEINAETKKSLNNAFEELAQALSKAPEDHEKFLRLKEIKDPLEREEKIFLFVRDQLKSFPHWFLIYDNVENFNDIRKYIPADSSLWGAGKIIITTRDEHIQSHSQVKHAVRVGELGQQEKLALFYSIVLSEQDKSSISVKKEQTESFLEKIPPFPLDVSLAGNYIKATNITYSKYLDYLYNNNLEFSSLQETVLSDTSSYSKTRYRIISLALKEMLNLNKTAADLLLLISLLDSQYIPKELLDTHKSDVAVDSLVYQLKKYSLISSHTSHSSNTTYIIHRSIQEIMLNHLTKILGLKKSKGSVARVSWTLIKYMRDIIDQEDLPAMKDLIVHGERILTHKNLLNDTCKGQILGELGYIYYYIGDFVRSRESLERGLVYLQNSSDKNYGGIARVLTYLGKLSWALGNYEKAKGFFNESMHVSKTHLFEDHIEVAHALANLGLVYRYEGNNEKARALTDASLKIYDKHLSRKDVRLGSVLGNLGIIHMNLGDYKKAEVYLDQSLLAYKSYSEDHIGVGWAKAYLGNVHSLLGDYQKAKDLLEQSLSFYKKHLSENHVGIARDLNFLGVLHMKTKDYGKAKTFLKQSLTIFRKNFKEDHPDIIKVLATLSEIEAGYRCN